jgi:histidinol-phosphate aminotransferase
MITQAAGGTNVVVPLKDNRHDLDAMADRISEKTKIIFIANPNNPTGTMNTSAEMDRLMSNVPDHVIVAVDEAYYEYVSRADYPDSLDYLKAAKNVSRSDIFKDLWACRTAHRLRHHGAGDRGTDE